MWMVITSAVENARVCPPHEHCAFRSGPGWFGGHHRHASAHQRGGSAPSDGARHAGAGDALELASRVRFYSRARRSAARFSHQLNASSWAAHPLRELWISPRPTLLGMSIVTSWMRFPFERGALRCRGAGDLGRDCPALPAALLGYGPNHPRWSSPTGGGSPFTLIRRPCVGFLGASVCSRRPSAGGGPGADLHGARAG